MSINQRIKQVRLTLTLSQAKFAKEISISNGYIAGIELENNKVNDRIVKLVCITFNVNENWLRTGEGEMFNEKPDHLLESATATFQKLKPEYQEYVLRQIEELLSMQKKEDKKKAITELKLKDK